MFKHALVVTSLLSLLIAGCSSNMQSSREVDGNDNYLKAPILQPLIIPEGMALPPESNEYHVYKAAQEGAVGKALDIRPPALALPTIADSYASYNEGQLTFDAPEYSGFWAQVPSILSRHNISIEHSDENSIKTGVWLASGADESQSIQASYSLKRKLQGGREYVTIELTSLKNAGQDITSLADSQRYTVGFFNMLMNDVSSSRAKETQ